MSKDNNQNLTPAQKRAKKINTQFWRNRIKKAMESAILYKNRKLTKAEKLAVEDLSDTIQIADLRTQQIEKNDDPIWTGKAQNL